MPRSKLLFAAVLRDMSGHHHEQQTDCLRNWMYLIEELGFVQDFSENISQANKYKTDTAINLTWDANIMFYIYI